MRNRYMRVALVLVLFNVICQIPAESRSTGSSDIQGRLIAPLRQAGFDPDLNPDLLKALWHEQVAVRSAAIRLLTDKNVKEAIPEFRKLLGDEHDSLRLLACRGLAVLGDRRNVWRIVAIGLLQSEDNITAIRAAGLLAQYEDTQGWPLVRERLFDNDGLWVFEATQLSPHFNGKKTLKDQAVIAVIDDAIAAFMKASTEESQLHLVTLMSKVATKADIAALEACLGLSKSKLIADGIQSIIERLKKQI